ncbi:sigma-70 family RNA polymerase sigma factor [Allorhodopirellula heiligendammensis]|uniref:RNA polymerase sigma factor n=1 Tax=Allorhodopirellula heiligendammensis TaxID=2714739 RepID=A0A5C6C4U7_9BACT|nr:sigma-70 family RNA polymerase sigma factor [Allorhodopirellula heiligendammensis]TWU19017.1 RNA polymerase sigma factor [Allorhodopirellula heiligendammensis]
MEPHQQSDDETEFVAMLTGNQSAIVLAVRALMPGERSVDEVVQQTNAKLWQKRGDFERGTNFRAWAAAIARYEVLNYRKQQARDSRLTFSDELEHQIASEVGELNDDLLDRHAALQECLHELKPESRELLLSRYNSDETLAELACRIGRSVGGVKVTLCRLRTSLAQCIERRRSTEEGLV